MRYPASEKLEIIRLVEQSHLPVCRTLAQIRIPRSTFYRWCDQYQTGGPEALDDRSPRPDRVWNRIPDDVRASRLLESDSLLSNSRPCLSNSPGPDAHGGRSVSSPTAHCSLITRN
jgi:transposase-like protein